MLTLTDPAMRKHSPLVS